MRLFLLFLILLPLTLHSAPPTNLAPVKQWITRQTEFRSVSADLVQTRSLRSLRNPLTTPGHLWFVAPNSFRWELGEPVKTVVLRQGEFIHVITPAKKKAERHPANNAGKNQGMQGMGMITFPLAKDFPDFNRQFEILSVVVDGNKCRLDVLPRNPQTRKMLTALKIEFDTQNGKMSHFEIVTRDGSSLKNEFTNIRVNPKIERKMFEFDFEGFEVVDAK